MASNADKVSLLKMEMGMSLELSWEKASDKSSWEMLYFWMISFRRSLIVS